MKTNHPRWLAVAAIGLAALLVGLVGDISVLLRSLVASFGSGLWEEFSYFTAAIIAGLPVWIIPWRKVNNAAVSAEPTSLEERCSVVRKVYLYFFLFIATMTIFSSAVFIIFKILSMILGGGMLTLTELGSAIADSLIATGVLLYHGSLLRGDSRRARSEQARQLEAAGVVILDVGEGQLGQAVVAELKHENPAITLEPIMLPLQAVEAEGTDEWLETILRQIATAQLIVAPWMVAVAGGAVPTRIAEAVASSPAHKLLVPSPAQGWDWVGIEPWKFDEIANHTVKSMKQLMAGEAVKLHRPLGVGAIIGIVIGVLIILGLIGFSFYNFLWY